MNRYILSTMTAGVNYTTYRNVGGLPVVVRKVLIYGGAGIPSEKSGFGEVVANAEGKPIWTADGIVTPVSEEDYLLLKDHKVFQKHMDKGYLKVINADIRGNHKQIQKYAGDMHRDGFGQLTKQNIDKRIKVTVTKPEVDKDYQL